MSHLKNLVCVLSVAFALAGLGQGSVYLDPNSAIVLVETESMEMDCSLPWLVKSTEKITGTGFVIGGDRILTSVHAIDGDTVKITVKKANEEKRWLAKIQHIGRGCDLAVLVLDDQKFFDGMNLLSFDEVYPSGQSISVVGYPVGQEQAPSSFTGKYRKFGWGVYDRWICERLLYGETDVPFEFGLMGSPVFCGEKMVGVFSAILNQDNEFVSRIIPTEVVNHFLKDISDGTFNGIGEIGAECVYFLNPAQRKRFGVSEGMGGILVIKVFTEGRSPGEQVLQVDDVILGVNGKKVSDKGQVDYKGASLNFRVLFSLVQANEKVKLDVVRNGKLLSLDIVLKPAKFAVPSCRERGKKEYYIAGGVVFTPLNSWYLMQLSETNSTSNLFQESDRRQVPERPETIVLSSVLVDEINEGYNTARDVVVYSVNGVPIRNLRHLVALVENCTDDFVVFLTIGEGEAFSHYPFVFETATLRSANNRILKKYEVPARSSAGLSNLLRK